MTRIPAGGPANFNGVLYQMLWTILQAAQVQIASFIRSPDGSFESAVLVAEPNGGGDLRVAASIHTVVMQIKSKADQSAWSLREIIESVIPDLYLSCGEHIRDLRFEFVTEGHRGDWEHVEAFFKSLKQRVASSQHPALGLSDEPLTFRRKQSSEGSFFPEIVTERSLLQQICKVIRETQERRKITVETLESIFVKLCQLLPNLEFIWGRTSKLLENDINTFLLDVLDFDTQVDATRQAMIGDLIERCRTGVETIVPRTFFEKHGVATTPFSAQADIKMRASEAIDEALAIRKYDPTHDVRADVAERLMRNWPDRLPMVAVSGESGMGKSWRLFAMANAAKDQEVLPVFLESPDSADDVFKEVEKAFCRFRDSDNGPSIERYARRRKRLLLSKEKPWLVLIIDSIENPDVARQLVRQPWERWEVRAVFSCHPQIAQTIAAEALERCRIEEVEPFSVKQTQEFLARNIGPAWTDIPPDVLAILRQPLLAQIFCRSVVSTFPEPRNEYELFDRFWHRISLDGFPLDSAALESLTESVINGAAYPWTSREIFKRSVASDTLRRLDQAGWIRRTASDCYEFSNDRLLNWAVARVFSSWLREGIVTIAALADQVWSFFKHIEKPSKRYLGYVAMDVVWIIANDAGLRHEIPDLLEHLEHKFAYDDALYKHLLPTIGQTIIPGLTHRLKANAANDFMRSAIAKGLAATHGDLNEVVTSFLRDSDCQVRICGILIAARRPSSDYLEQLWLQHNEICSSPEKWKADDRTDDSYIHQQSLKALKACSVLKPDWIAAKIQVPGESCSNAVHDLVWMLVHLDPEVARTLWQTGKQTLLQIIPEKKQRCLAWCMCLFPNPADEAWLVDRLDREDEFIGGIALDALARINVTTALRELWRVPPFVARMTRNGGFSSLLIRDPVSTCRSVLALMRNSKEPWQFCGVWFGSEMWLDDETMTFLVESFRDRLRIVVDDSSISNDVLYESVSLLAKLVTAAQIQLWQSYRGTSLESDLVNLVRQEGPRGGVDRDSFTRDFAVEILSRIGGSGISEAVNLLLSADSVYGRLDGVKFAAYRRDSQTMAHLAAIVAETSRDDGEWMPRRQAAQSLIFWQQWTSLVPYFEHHWPKIDRDVPNLLAVIQPLPTEIIEPIRHSVQLRMAGVPPGLVVLLGYSGIETDADLVRSIFTAAERGSELAAACAIALERLGDKSPESVPLFKRELGLRNDHCARYALIRNRTDDAVAVLLDQLKVKFEIDTAANLLNDQRTREQAIDVAIDRLKNRQSFLDYQNDVRALIEWVSDPATLRRIMTGDAVQDILHWDSFAPEANFRHVGWKAACIKALSFFDNGRAIQAAVRVLCDGHHKDRERFAALLVHLDETIAVDFLLDHIAGEDSDALRAAIGRALATVIPITRLIDLLSSDTRQRITALRAIGWSAIQLPMLPHVKEQLGYHVSTVVDEAAKAIYRLQRVLETENLVAQLLRVEQAEDKWVFLDGLLSIADPGEVDADPPEWADRVRPSLHPMQRQFMRVELIERRKKLKEKLK